MGQRDRPDLVGQPRYVSDHSAPVTRTPQQEEEWQTLLGSAEILFDFDYSHRQDLPDLAHKLQWIQSTSAGIGQFVHRMQFAERTDWVFTTASGVHARPLAEFALKSGLPSWLASRKLVLLVLGRVLRIEPGEQHDMYYLR